MFIEFEIGQLFLVLVICNFVNEKSEMTSKIKTFLSSFKTDSWKELANSTMNKIVIGNESCDLDSAISAVTYAHFLQSLDKKMEFGVVYPVLNIKRKEFSLRTEVNYWFEKFAIMDDLLLFRDDIDLTTLATAGNLQLYLVDHNLLIPSDASLEPFVVSVLDHHQLERTDTPVYGMTVEPVGSCATLVTSEIESKNPDAMDEEIAHLLYGTILLDTVNLSESAKRMTPKDVAMIEYLETFLKIGNDKRSLVFEELIAAKSDISRLSSEQIFMKDLKIVFGNNICVAISSIPQLIKTYLLRADIDNCLRDIAESSNFDIIVLMGIDVSGEVERDLALVSQRKVLRDELSSYLANGRNGILELEKLETYSNKNAFVFNQRNRTASRKVVLPLVREWLDSKK